MWSYKVTFMGSGFRMWKYLGRHYSAYYNENGEGNGNPLQCSCLENPRDGGAWWTAVYGVAQSRSRLKRLNSNSSTMRMPKAPHLKRREAALRGRSELIYNMKVTGEDKALYSVKEPWWGLHCPKSACQLPRLLWLVHRDIDFFSVRYHTGPSHWGYYLFKFLAMPCSLWGLSSLTRDWTWALSSKSAES